MDADERSRNPVFSTQVLADKMQIATGATFLAAAVGFLSTVMLIDSAWAVEAERPSPDSFVLGSRSFKIPFSVDAVGHTPLEVQLFVSRGPSQPWTLLESKRPGEVTEKQFQFTADRDGEFWFATRTTPAATASQLASSVPAQLKVFVDTTEPAIELNAEADADGQVEAQLTVQDATPVKTIKLRYVTDTVSTWQEVELVALAASGQLQFTPAHPWQQLSLQAIAVDAAGNQSVVNRLVRRPRVAAAPANRYAMVPWQGPLGDRQTPYQLSRSDVTLTPQHAGASSLMAGGLHGFRGAAFPQATTSPQATGGLPATLPPATGARPESIPAPPPGAQQEPPREAPSIYARPTPIKSNSGLPSPATPEQISSGFGLTPPQQLASPPSSGQPGLQSAGQPETLPTPRGERDSADPAAGSRQPVSQRPPRTLAEAIRPLSPQEPELVKPELIKPELNQSDSSAHENASSPAAGDQQYQSARPGAAPPMSSRAPLRFSDSERFSLRYELEAVGSQGVEAIELYGTVDEGRTWKLWGRDPDRQSPFDIETREEGLFGYRIVVVGNNGLNSPRPLDGEAPDIMVLVDKQPPQVRLSGAQYGTGDRIGALVIQYECSDENLTPRPIALSFGESTEGPWTTIAAGLLNDGTYVWPADPKLPRQFFLRIDATDQAGNVGTAVLDQPIDAQGLAPRARIRGFQSLSENPPGAEFR